MCKGSRRILQKPFMTTRQVLKRQQLAAVPTNLSGFPSLLRTARILSLCPPVPAPAEASKLYLSLLHRTHPPLLVLPHSLQAPQPALIRPNPLSPNLNPPKLLLPLRRLPPRTALLHSFIPPEYPTHSFLRLSSPLSVPPLPPLSSSNAALTFIPSRCLAQENKHTGTFALHYCSEAPRFTILTSSTALLLGRKRSCRRSTRQKSGRTYAMRMRN